MRVAKRLDRAARGSRPRSAGEHHARESLANRQLDRRELQVDQRRQDLVLGQIGKTIRRRADKHAEGLLGRVNRKQTRPAERPAKRAAQSRPNDAVLYRQNRPPGNSAHSPGATSGPTAFPH